MKVAKWFYLGVPVLIGVGMLVASQPDERKQEPPPRRIKFIGPDFKGRPLREYEYGVVEAAIESIRTPPPDSISWTDAAGSTKTVSCSTYADLLKRQLRSGRIQAEIGTTRHSGANHLSDGKATDKDQMNVDSQLIEWTWNHPDSIIYLEETLIHEGTHKWQSTSVMTFDEREIDALRAELAYKDSNGLDTSDAYYRFKDTLLFRHKFRHFYPYLVVRLLKLLRALGYNVFIHHDPYGLGVDYFASFKPGDTDWYEFDLGYFLRASDMAVFENHFMLPPGHCLALMCGGVPSTGTARIWAFEVLGGEIIGPLVNYDFGPLQGYPPMFFYNMTRNTETGCYYMSDTLNKEIVLMGDAVYDDYIPDEIIGVYASALWPGFEPLETMRGVEVAMHPTQGFGIIIYEGDMRDSDVYDPYDDCFFLPDADGNDTADACIPSKRYEFVVFTPDVQYPMPWVGEDFVQLFAPWDHFIDVYSTDSLGQTLYELLGTTQMTGGVDAECMLSRPLMEGEFVLAVDAGTGDRIRCATKVIDPVPKEFTIHYLSGVLLLQWDEVPGVDHYNIYQSDDPVEFSLEPTFISYTNEFALPMMPNEKLFFRVTAER